MKTHIANIIPTVAITLVIFLVCYTNTDELLKIAQTAHIQK